MHREAPHASILLRGVDRDWPLVMNRIILKMYHYSRKIGTFPMLLRSACMGLKRVREGENTASIVLMAGTVGLDRGFDTTLLDKS